MSRRHDSVALAPTAHPTFDLEYLAHVHRAAARGSDRRAHARLNPAELSARLKYGDTVTLVDVSVGGALVETTRVLRPDTDLVLEILDTRTRDIAHVIARVLRSQVAGIDGGIRYRGACRFKRPLSHPALVVPPSAGVMHDARDFLKLEFALKTIVEGFFRPSAGSGATGRWRDEAALLDSLIRLRAAAERRNDLLHRQLAPLLNSVIPALQQQQPAGTIVRDLQALLARELPLLTIRAGRPQYAVTTDCEVVTFSIAAGADQARVHVTAEFPPGFALDETQFRLLKAGAYLVGLVTRWHVADEEEDLAPTDVAAPPPPVSSFAPLPEAPTEIALAPERALALEHRELPAGWQRLVVRFVDGHLLRGYANAFSPERGHLDVSPRVNCPANERLLVPFSRVKAVFFVKSLSGDPGRIDDQTFDELSVGARRVEVTYRDGESMRGSTVSYKPNARGFFLQPPNGRGNNQRIYVVSAAVARIRFV